MWFLILGNSKSRVWEKLWCMSDLIKNIISGARTRNRKGQEEQQWVQREEQVMQRYSMQLATPVYNWVLDLWTLRKDLFNALKIIHWKGGALICQLISTLVKFCHMAHKLPHFHDVHVCLSNSIAGIKRRLIWAELRKFRLHNASQYLCRPVLCNHAWKEWWGWVDLQWYKEMSNICIYVICFIFIIYRSFKFINMDTFIFLWTLLNMLIG